MLKTFCGTIRTESLGEFTRKLQKQFASLLLRCFFPGLTWRVADLSDVCIVHIPLMALPSVTYRQLAEVNDFVWLTTVTPVFAQLIPGVCQYRLNRRGMWADLLKNRSTTEVALTFPVTERFRSCSFPKSR